MGVWEKLEKLVGVPCLDDHGGDPGIYSDISWDTLGFHIWILSIWAEFWDPVSLVALWGQIFDLGFTSGIWDWELVFSKILFLPAANPPPCPDKVIG